LNFKLQENIYKGYFPDKNNPIDLNFKKLRIVDNDNEARGYTVVFVSKKPRKPGM
jgi:hypothetical protein